MKMPITKKTRAYVSPAGRTRYGDDVFDPPVPRPEPKEGDAADSHVAAVDPDLVERFHAIVEQLTDELMTGGNFERASCRADAITLLTVASDRLQQGATVESPLAYLLREERAKALLAFGATASHVDASTFLKV